MTPRNPADRPATEPRTEHRTWLDATYKRLLNDGSQMAGVAREACLRGIAAIASIEAEAAQGAAPRAEGTDRIFAAMKKGADAAWAAPRAEGLDEAALAVVQAWNGYRDDPRSLTPVSVAIERLRTALRPSDERVPESEERA